jgi:hypothetical protein
LISGAFLLAGLANTRVKRSTASAAIPTTPPTAPPMAAPMTAGPVPSAFPVMIAVGLEVVGGTVGLKVVVGAVGLPVGCSVGF